MDFEAAWSKANALAAAGQSAAALGVYSAMAGELMATRDSLPPIELLERIARASSRLGAHEPAVRIVSAARDAAREAKTERAERTAEHLGFVLVHLCLAAGDVESAGAFLEDQLGELPTAAPPRGSGFAQYEAAVALGRFWAASGVFQRAIQLFDAALAVPDVSGADAFYPRADVELRRAQCLAEHGDWRGAAKAATGGDVRSRILRARIERQLGRLEEARTELEAVAAAKPLPRIEAHARLALVTTYLLLNRLEQATSELSALGALADRTAIDGRLVASLRGAIDARRADLPSHLALPFVPEQAWSLGEDEEAEHGAIELGVDESERFVDRWNAVAAKIMIALASERLDVAREALALLEELTGTSDSRWLSGRLAYYDALVRYADRDWTGALASAEVARTSADALGLRLEAWQARHLESWCRLSLSDEPGYAKAAEQAKVALEEIAKSLGDEDRHYFLLNKWSARDEYISARLRGAEAPGVRSRWPVIGAWLDRRDRRRRAAEAQIALAALTGWDVERHAEGGAGADPSAAATPNQIEEWVRGQLEQRRAAQTVGFGTAPGLALARALPAEVAVLQLFVAPTMVAAFVVTRGDLRLEIIPISRVDLDERVRAFRRAIAAHKDASGSEARPPRPKALAKAEDALATAGKRLAEALGLDRLELAGRERLVIIPHDVLSNLPWAALPIGPKRLVEEHALSVVPSVAWVDCRRGKPAPPAKLCAISRSSFGERGLAELPGTAAECAAVTALFPSHEWLRDDDASLERVLAALGRADWAHFATHGTFEVAAPFASRLVLSTDPAKDLTLERLRGTDLRGLRGAVLSACEAGLGAALVGQELIGLPSALLLAGVSGVIAPLWKIDDDATARLIHAFYTELARAAAPVALARVQRQWARSEHPWDATPARWAGFVHNGN